MIRYALSWSNPHEHLFDVSIAFTAPADDPRLLLPAWRPGRYLIQNYAANVRGWTASNASGDPLDIAKDGKSSWRVAARAGDEVTVRYRFYAGVLDAGSSFLDETEGYFNGTNLFMMVEGLRNAPVTLTIGAPSDWRIETQLPKEATHPDRSDAETAFSARDYDHLIDSPTIAAPRFTRHSFVESGATIHLIFVGDEGIDTEQFVDPVRAIVREQAALFDGLPIPEYRFLTHIADKWHGVEHEASCSIVANRNDLLGAKPGDASWDHFSSICSHEFFHTWNVKRILPAAFAPYDYSAEALTRLLWAMEGITSYFGDLTLVRSGVWTEARYLEHLRDAIEVLENAPGRSVISLAQASFDSWLQNDMHDRANALISFYNKGEVVGAMLDLTLRVQSGGATSLDDVMRLLWSDYGQTGRGMEENAFRRAAESFAPVGGFFESYVEGTEPLPYAELLAAAGVGFEATPREAGSALGATLRSEGGRLVVVNAISSGAAAAAGLLPGDEIIAIDGTRTTTDAEAQSALRCVGDGVGVEMLVGRGGVVRSMTLTGAPDPRVKIGLSVAGASALRDRWLGRRNA